MHRNNPPCYSQLFLKLFSWTLFILIQMIHSKSFSNRTGASDTNYSYSNNTQKIHGSWGKNRSYLKNYLEKMFILCNTF